METLKHLTRLKDDGRIGTKSLLTLKLIDFGITEWLIKEVCLIGRYLGKRILCSYVLETGVLLNGMISG